MAEAEDRASRARQCTSASRADRRNEQRPLSVAVAADWDYDYYSRPSWRAVARKRWELLICSTPDLCPGSDGIPLGQALSRQQRQFLIWLPGSPCLKGESPAACTEVPHTSPTSLLARFDAKPRCKGRPEAIGLGLCPVAAVMPWSNGCPRHGSFRSIPAEPGYMAGPLAPVPVPVPQPPVQTARIVKG